MPFAENITGYLECIYPYILLAHGCTQNFAEVELCNMWQVANCFSKYGQLYKFIQ